MTGCGRSKTNPDIETALLQSAESSQKPKGWELFHDSLLGYSVVVPNDIEKKRPLLAVHASGDREKQILYQVNCPPRIGDRRSAEARTEELATQMAGIGAELLLNKSIELSSGLDCRAFAFLNEGVLQMGRIYVIGDREYGVMVTINQPDEFPMADVSFFFESFTIN